MPDGGIREVFGPAVEVNATAGGQSAKTSTSEFFALNVGTTVIELKGISPRTSRECSMTSILTLPRSRLLLPRKNWEMLSSISLEVQWR